MAAVAVGHWLAAAVIQRPDGGLEGANAITYATGLHGLTWLFQVMPLFFLVGGFANAASLDAARRSGTPDHVWLAGRLRRLITPAAVFAAVWGVAGVAAQVLGIGLLAAAGAAAVIPLWFLANYTIDTVAAPTVLRLYRRYGWAAPAALAALVATLDVARLAGVPYLPWANWVLGWVFFQCLGVAWRDRRSAWAARPAMRRLAGGGAVALSAAAALVAFGPWSASMVHAPGLTGASNTWPPSLPLLLFGIGQCLLAVAAAPALDGLLERSARLWTLVVAANGVAMSVYLWHFTAMTLVAAPAFSAGLLPVLPIGTAGWWATKALLMAGATVVLGGIVAAVARHERAGLTRSSAAVPAGRFGVYGLAVVAAIAFEAVTLLRPGTPAGALGCATVVGVWALVRRSRGAGRTRRIDAGVLVPVAAGRRGWGQPTPGLGRDRSRRSAAGAGRHG
jgi:hypothetical protein